MTDDARPGPALRTGPTLPTGPTLLGELTSGATLVVVALPEEARHVVVEHPVLVTGVGKLAAGLAVSRVLATGPRPALVVNIGTAGGLRPGVTGTHEIGRVLQHDFDDAGVHALTGRHDGPPIDLDTSDTSETARPTGPPVSARPVTLATGDRFVAGGPERDRVAALADLVDMEGYAVAAACRDAGVPVRIVKTVSDPADDDALDTWADSVDACARVLAGWLREHLG